MRVKASIAALVFASMIYLGGCSDAEQAESAGTKTPDAAKLSDSRSGLFRTDEEIQSVFERDRSRLYEAYQRYLTKQPTLQGYVQLRITIEPNGVVSTCSIESTDIPSKALLADIVDEVKQFDFGDRTNVPSTTIIYPINFVPASSVKTGRSN